MTHTNDDILNTIFEVFKPIETKEEITRAYIEGKITKNEFLKRMKSIDVHI